MSTEPVTNGRASRERDENDEKEDRDEQANTPFSWLHPHAIFVIILVGEEEIPFGIQKDFLCAKSSHYRALFAEKNDDQLEHVVKLPATTPEVFGLAQNFLYTGRVFSDSDSLPGYEVLIATWKLGNDLGIEGLCEEALEAMTECRKVTQHIPATPLLVKAWKETPEGSSIRKLLLTWAAEYIRSSESRSEFSKSLPQEVLSELVVAMSHLNSAPVIQVNHVSSPAGQSQRKNVHYLEADESDAESQPKSAKHRHSDVMPSRPASNERKQASKKASAKASLPPKPPKAKRSSINVASDGHYSSDQKLNFCADLLNRMLSGPGFWTRLVGPFREPVRPVEDGVPDYFEKVTKPMDLGTIKAKMDAGEYGSEAEFAADVRQIFQNCYTYWTRDAGMWTTCEKFEKTFEEKYALMPKWISKMEGEEA
ncbi:Bromodomain-containing protein [Biscogniauxia mediterranea]|nr:Bromodomain-containing protein [Biscogniauxia mediterranea]